MYIQRYRSTFNVSIWLIILSALVLSPLSAIANSKKPKASTDSSTPLQFSLNGKVKTFKQTSFPSVKAISFIAKSKVNFSQPINLTVRAPIGSRIKVEGISTSSSTILRPIKKKLYSIPMRSLKGHTLKQVAIIRSSLKSAPASALALNLRYPQLQSSLLASSSPNLASAEEAGECCGFSMDTIKGLIESFQFDDPNCKISCVCDYLKESGICSGLPNGNGSGNGSSGGNNSGNSSNPIQGEEGVDSPQYRSITLKGIFQKDSCNAPKPTSYALVTVDVSKVKRKKLKNGLTVKVSAEEASYKGSRAASIKPISDGKYAPKPLLLMATTYSVDEFARVVRWSGGKPKIEKIYKTLDSAYYRNLSLIRVPVELPGGFATVELLDEADLNSGYSVCLEMSRKRQRINGYPGSVEEDL